MNYFSHEEIPRFPAVSSIFLQLEKPTKAGATNALKYSSLDSDRPRKLLKQRYCKIGSRHSGELLATACHRVGAEAARAVF